MSKVDSHQYLWICIVHCCNGEGYCAKGFMYRIHYSDVITSIMVSQITSVSSVYSTVCSGIDQRKHQSPESVAFTRGIHQWPMNSPHKGPVTLKIFPFDDVIMTFVLSFVLIYHQLIVASCSEFTHIVKGHFTGTGVIIWWPNASKVTLRNKVKYKTNHNSTTTEPNKAWMMSIVPGMYC